MTVPASGALPCRNWIAHGALRQRVGAVSKFNPYDEDHCLRDFSTRRQEEITRIQWSDYEGNRVLVRDMKDPANKAGNHIWCDLLAEASAIIETMPKSDARIFPYNSDSIGTAFTRACKISVSPACAFMTCAMRAYRCYSRRARPSRKPLPSADTGLGRA